MTLAGPRSFAFPVMDKPSPLPGSEHDATFEAARQLIWPDTPWSSEITEPARLTQIIYTYTEPDKQWLTINGDGDVPMSEPADADVPIGEPADAGDVSDILAEVRYIDLSRHSELLEFKRLGAEVTIHEEKATFIVREEYKEFIKHALSHRSLFRCFVTGQPGIGKSSRCSGFRAHGSRRQAGLSGRIFPHVPPRLGKRLVDPKTVPTSFDFQRALRNSWVLIDVDQDPMPNTTYNLSPYVIWTSSPRDLRWRYFRKHFWPCERWFMKPWSAKEIMAAADRLGIDHDDVTARMTWCGPVARFLFQGAPLTAQDVSNDIGRALSGNPFAVEAQPGTEGAQPVHAVFLIVPAIVKDDGGHRLVRQNFYTEFLTPAVAEMTFALAENRMEQLQLHLSRAFDISSTRGVAGKLVEGLMHRSLSRGMRLPDIFGGGSVAATLELLASPVPPPTVAFAAVDAMVALSDGRLVLLQTSLADTHSRDFGTMLRIIARLPNGAGVHVGDGVFYCLVGSTDFRVRNLAHTAANTLTWLQGLSEDSPKKFSDEVGVATEVARQRIRHFQVVGLTFDHQIGFNNIAASPTPGSQPRHAARPLTPHWHVPVLRKALDRRSLPAVPRRPLPAAPHVTRRPQRPLHVARYAQRPQHGAVRRTQRQTFLAILLLTTMQISLSTAPSRLPLLPLLHRLGPAGTPCALVVIDVSDEEPTSGTPFTRAAAAAATAPPRSLPHKVSTFLAESRLLPIHVKRKRGGGSADLQVAVRMGYSLILKASAGGGGTGMAICGDEHALPDAFTRLKQRAESTLLPPTLTVAICTPPNAHPSRRPAPKFRHPPRRAVRRTPAAHCRGARQSILAARASVARCLLFTALRSRTLHAAAVHVSVEQAPLPAARRNARRCTPSAARRPPAVPLASFPPRASRRTRPLSHPSAACWIRLSHPRPAPPCTLCQSALTAAALHPTPNVRGTQHTPASPPLPAHLPSSQGRTRLPAPCYPLSAVCLCPCQRRPRPSAARRPAVHPTIPSPERTKQCHADAGVPALLDVVFSTRDKSRLGFQVRRDKVRWQNQALPTFPEI
ncbi:hypothetical protein GGX14DRAFT_662032 [Mycena pura]|uniref:Carbamoyl phosphate synthase ATP-binding domain-containing protein n=1 Tax=Mycena pura TaxID=153505 RepID=A0AAD6V0B5_9AGAR|nr:hypothetical protein GGX14DRAFT_662032 [Mycena pura]